MEPLMLNSGQMTISSEEHGGRIARINNQGSGQIELPSGLRAFFIPSRGGSSGGYLAGQDIGREVEFYLGFSYDGLSCLVSG